MFYPQFLLYSQPPVRPDQEGAAREGELDGRGRAGVPDPEEGPNVFPGPPRPGFQLPLHPIHRRLWYRAGSSPFPDQGRTEASHGLHQPQALPRRNKVCGTRKGGPGHKVGSPGAEVLPLGPPLHPCYGPRTATVDVEGEGYQRPGDAVVPGAPGLPLPGATLGRGRPRECGRTDSPVAGPDGQVWQVREIPLPCIYPPQVVSSPAGPGQRLEGGASHQGVEHRRPGNANLTITTKHLSIMSGTAAAHDGRSLKPGEKTHWGDWILYVCTVHVAELTIKQTLTLTFFLL